MKLTQSEIKTDERGYNNMPSREEIYTMVTKMLPEAKWMDSPKAYWQNGSDTVALAIDTDELSTRGAAKIMKNINDLRTKSMADEFDIEQDGGMVIIRIWWD